MYNQNLKGMAMVAFAITLPAALVACAVVVSETARATVPSNQIVKVRGVAERAIQSDRVNWSFSVRSVRNDRDAAYARVDESVARLVKYLEKNGIAKSKLNLGAYSQYQKTRRVVLDELGNDKHEFVGWNVSRTIELKKFTDLDLIEKLNNEISSDLLREGWPIDARTPYFFFSKPVTDIKPKLLEEAAKNAFSRATIVASSSGSELGGLRAARQGAFEGLGSDGFVGGAQREHRIRAIVTVDYSIAR